MITEFGKVLRIIRINSGDSAKDMAEKLNISASYLSAIENGKRNIPVELENEIINVYNLSAKEKEKLLHAMSESAEGVKIDMSTIQKSRRQVIFALAKYDLDDATIQQLCEVIDQNRNKED